MKNSGSAIDLSIVVPVYNEEAVIGVFIARLMRVLKELPELFEIIVVDDGSYDGTFTEIHRTSVGNSQIRGIRLSRNFGKEAAMLAGLERSLGRAVVIIDGDGQHPPELIPDMLAIWRLGEADLVSAFKRERSADSMVARLNAAIFNRVMKQLTGLDLAGASDFRLMDRRVVDAVIAMPERVRFFRGMTLWVGFREARVPFDVSERMAGSSSWTSRGLIKLAITAITSFTAKPLSWVFSFGCFGLAISVVLTLQAMYSWLLGIAVSGWTSLTMLILFFGSANLIALGLLGIYIARVFEEVKQRPVYLVRETTGELADV
ncbi:MAG: glycosyltransferase family 2 protein [Nitrospirae bacterium]|nr:glycosyltransferase family 2 protein [Nitrospirota bacterium]